jgi:hypothetical protein
MRSHAQAIGTLMGKRNGSEVVVRCRNELEKYSLLDKV